MRRWLAEIVAPIRKHGNLLLCTLLIGNTVANCAPPLLHIACAFASSCSKCHLALDDALDVSSLVLLKARVS